MKAWVLPKLGGALELRDVSEPTARPTGAVVRIEAAPILSYTKRHLNGELPYQYPTPPFVPGTNGVGTVVAVGEGVYHLRAGQRVAVSPYWVVNEAVETPARALIGLTGLGEDSARLIHDYRDGTWRQLAEFPAATLIPLDGLDRYTPEQLCVLAKLVVPFGGLRRGRLAAGETAIVNGATGYFGSAAVLCALGLGAEKVVAVGRNAEALMQLESKCGSRVVPVSLTGDFDTDCAKLRAASGGAHIALDIVGRATSADSTRATLKSLTRGGRLVLMGSMNVPLHLNYGEMLSNTWEVLGHLMYSQDDYRSLVAIVRAGLIDIGLMDIDLFAFADIEKAIDAASTMRALQSTVVRLPQ